jgi:hypothetical protein
MAKVDQRRLGGENLEKVRADRDHDFPDEHPQSINHKSSLADLVTTTSALKFSAHNYQIESFG